MQESKQELTKLFSLSKMTHNVPSLSRPLKVRNIFVDVQERKHEITKVIPLVKMAENLPRVSKIFLF